MPGAPNSLTDLNEILDTIVRLVPLLVGVDAVFILVWDEERQIDWAVRYWEAARRATLPVPDDFGEFWRQLEWMGLQRHLKVLGIFCRLKHRDGKPAYSADLQRFFAYATKVALRYTPLKPLILLIEPLQDAKLEVGYSF